MRKGREMGDNDLTGSERSSDQHSGRLRGLAFRLRRRCEWQQARILITVIAVAVLLMGQELVAAVLAVATEVGELIWRPAKKH